MLAPLLSLVLIPPTLPEDLSASSDVKGRTTSTLYWRRVIGTLHAQLDVARRISSYPLETTDALALSNICNTEWLVTQSVSSYVMLCSSGCCACAWPLRKKSTGASVDSQLRSRDPLTPAEACLPLLPSGPDGVHRHAPQRAQPSSPLIQGRLCLLPPRGTLRFHCSGL